MKPFLAAVALVALVACSEPPDPHLSRLSTTVTILLLDRRQVRCDEVKEAGGGWECWPSLDKLRWKYRHERDPDGVAWDHYMPTDWFNRSQVKEIRRVTADRKGTE